VVLTSTILTEAKGRPVPAMELDRIRVPVLVVHHQQDGCSLCPFSQTPTLMAMLTNSPRKQLLSFQGGRSTGDPCGAFAYHGYNGLESDVVRQVAAWVLAR
jgi:hypothetical protein